MLDAICEQMVSSLSIHRARGRPVNEMLFIIRGELESSTTDGGRTNFLSSITLRLGDFFGEPLLTWVLMPNPSLNLRHCGAVGEGGGGCSTRSGTTPTSGGAGARTTASSGEGAAPRLGHRSRRGSARHDVKQREATVQGGGRQRRRVSARCHDGRVI